MIPLNCVNMWLKRPIMNTKYLYNNFVQINLLIFIKKVSRYSQTNWTCGLWWDEELERTKLFWLMRAYRQWTYLTSP